MLAVLQFDAAAVPLLERLVTAGRLPALADLRARGTWRPVDSIAASFPAATYQTLYTGLDLGEHGLYYPLQWSPAEQRVRFRTAFPAPPAAWERVAEAGRRAIVVDPYEAEPPRRFDGACVSGWQFVNRLTLEPWSRPRETRGRLARLLGRPRAVDEVFGAPTLRGLLETRRRLIEAPRRATEAALALLRDGGADLLWVSYLAPHLGGHQLWDLSQLEAGRLDSTTAGVLETALPEIYEATDAALGRLLAALPGDAHVIVLSTLGMDREGSRVDLLGGMLDAVLSDGASTAARRNATVPLWRLRAVVPTPVRAAVAGALGAPLAREALSRLAVAAVDWGDTRAFVLPSDHNGQVRVNLRGREREGIVPPEELDELCERIASGLATFHDPDGTPSVAAVERTSDVVGPDAPRLELLPDLVVHWGPPPAGPLAGVTSPRYGTVPRVGSGSGRSGAHTSEGWMLVVPAAGRASNGHRPARLEDVAATACALLGADASGLAGEPLVEPE